MPLFDFICLANSKKNHERCVAGIRVDDGRWIRPVSSRPHGELWAEHRLLGEHGEPQKFDLLRVGCANPHPTSGQPENRLIDAAPWQLVARPAPPALGRLLRARLSSDPLLFGDTSQSIPADIFQASRSFQSLLLVKPANPRWYVKEDEEAGKRRVRVTFSLSGIRYNLPVTDPPVEETLRLLAVGNYSSAEAGFAGDSRMLFTISLGEQTTFDNRCYKLVAAVLIPPANWPPLAPTQIRR